MSDSSDDEDDEFQPLEEMPSSRLQDIVTLLDKGVSSVVTVDACLPPKDAGELVLKTLLYKVQPCVKVLSLRFNQLSQYSCDLLIEWVSTNDHLETLYVMGSGLDEKSRSMLEDAWKKKLISHRTSNLGFTFVRVTHDKLPSKDA
mmetsp:Transcript_14664/g.32308  ORF Transcript_14664/g.32308 Transcript_14664/m.32308 type:complete len:145 (-) Transcript_14664:1442-1876(-)